MLFNYIINIIIHRGATYNAILLSPIHGLCIYIQAVFTILKENTLTKHTLKIFLSLLIYVGRIMIEVIRKIYFRLNHVIERVWITFGFCSRFFLVKHIIRTTCYVLH